jgi:hypothetical protein
MGELSQIAGQNQYDNTENTGYQIKSTGFK